MNEVVSPKVDQNRPLVPKWLMNKEDIEGQEKGKSIRNTDSLLSLIHMFAVKF